MDLGLRDHVVFVAGSSRGIGFAIASAFVAEGARVVVTGRDTISLEKAAATLAADAGVERVLACAGDMTDPADIARAVGDAVSQFGGLDVVVANVGDGAMRGGWDLTPEDWQTALRVNLLGGMTLATVTVPHLVARGGGALTFVSSIAGVEALTAPVTYGAAKAALQHAVKALARLLGGQGVRVNAVAPGHVLFPGGAWERRLAERREFFERYVGSEVPLRRFGRPEEIADAVVYLASARASFVTGTCLVVDGGQTRSVV